MSEETLQDGGIKEAMPDWYRLDNAAKIYPAIRNRKWASVFRLSVVLRENVRPDLLQRALDTTLKRIPGFAVKMKAGLFWYFFERNSEKPMVQQDVANPCMRMFGSGNGNYLFRVRWFGRRIALEMFHSVTDGYGGLTFLKTLTAEYLKLCGHDIPAAHGVLDCSEAPRPEEMEDNFAKYAKFRVVRSRKESRAYRLPGTELPPYNIRLVTGLIPLDRILAEARRRGVSLTEYLAGAYIYVLYNIQKACGGKHPVKVSVPVNMRRFYDSTTLRNFSSYINPGIDPRYGDYTLDEVISLTHHYLRYEITEKHLNARVAKNVKSERNFATRMLPLFAKNFALSMVFRFVGESRFTSTMSNLGPVDVPDEMKPHIEYFEAQLGPSLYNKVNFAVTSYGGTLCVSFTSKIVEPYVEREFFSFLVRQGISVKVFSNQE
jgi:hypothetical protein